MASYLLPCVCGRRNPVTASQAGEQLQCECGQKTEVPTLRHLAALERVEERVRPQRRERTWGARQGLVFLGATIIVIAAAALIFLQLHKPEEINVRPGFILFKGRAAQVDTMPANDAWEAWPQLERGITRPLSPYEVGLLIQRKEAMDNWGGLRLAALVAAAVGVLLVNIGYFFVRGKTRGRVLL